MAKNYQDKYDARFADYHGQKRYRVEHPEHKTVVVAAPDENADIMAAAKYWDEKWTTYDYYAYATVTVL